MKKSLPSPTSTDAVRALLYARSAHEDPSLPKNNVNSQLKELRMFVEAHGWVNQGEYADPDISGLKENRPGLNDLLETCRNNQVHVVVVTELSRLAREKSLTMSILNRLEVMGIRVVETKTE
jgi:DNA invertase Pin-like site-specific DNA recombinase